LTKRAFARWTGSLTSRIRKDRQSAEAGLSVRFSNRRRHSCSRAKRKRPSGFQTAFCLWGSGFLGSADRAGTCASAAGDAGIGIDDKLAIAFGNSINRAFASASAASDAFISDNVRHGVTPPSDFRRTDEHSIPPLFAFCNPLSFANLCHFAADLPYVSLFPAQVMLYSLIRHT